MHAPPTALIFFSASLENSLALTISGLSVDTRGGGDDMLCALLGPNAAGKHALKQSSRERGGADVMRIVERGTSAASHPTLGRLGPRVAVVLSTGGY